MPRDNKPPNSVCSVDLEAIAKAVNVEVNFEPTYDDLRRAMLAASSWSSWSGHVPVPESEMAKQREVFQGLLKPCATVANDLPGAKVLLDEFNKKIADADSAALGALKGYQQRLEELGLKCFKIAGLLQKGADSVKPGVANANQASADSCNYSVGYGDRRYGQATFNLSVPDDLFRRLLASKKDQDTFLKDMFSAGLRPEYFITSYMGINSTSENDSEACSYDPFKTAEAIENLLKLKCVKTIYVPDPWLMKRLSAHGRRVMYRPFEADDRFLIDISETKCLESEK